MATNAYLERLNQLDIKKAATVKEQADKILPMNRPLNRNAPAIGSGIPMKIDKPEEQGPDFNNMFGYNFNQFQEQDSRFGDFVKEYTKLAEGLQQEVSHGFMPATIAAQRLQSYLADSRQYFNTNEAKPMDNPKVRGVIEGLLASQMGNQQGQQVSQEVPQQGMEQGAPMIQEGGNNAPAI